MIRRRIWPGGALTILHSPSPQSATRPEIGRIGRVRVQQNRSPADYPI